jgi:hypothetical protein
MPEMKDFDWFADRLEVARWNNNAKGTRDLHANCPCCGGSDPLHLTEMNGKALLQCFSCSAKYSEIVEALESEPAQEEIAAPVIVRKRRNTQSVPVVNQTSTVGDPLQWYADYCGVDIAWLKTLPVSATADGWIAHHFAPSNVTKDRRPNSGDRRWTPSGSVTPRLWPSPGEHMPEEIWLTEGESDCIVMMAMGLDAYTAGSASQPLSAAEMRALMIRGVQRIVVAYDSDKAGVKASEETIETAREVGLGVSVASLGDPLLGSYKDWRDRWLQGERDIPDTDSKAGLENVWQLIDVVPAVHESLLLDRLHATDHTILFGDGGAGKGVIAAWWAARLSKGPKYHDKSVTASARALNVLVLDYEAHATHEWRPRVEKFRGDLLKVWIWQPYEPIWDIAMAVRAMITELSIDYVIVDSITYACVGEEVEKSVTATKYSQAISLLKCPVLSLAHVTKAADADNAKHPFGSIFWSNGARLTIGVSAAGMLEPRRVETRKANQGANFKVDIEWDWVSNDLPDTLVEGDAKGDNSAQVLNLMPQDGSYISVAAMQALVEADGGNPKQVSNTFQDLKKGNQVESGGPRVGWRLLGRAPGSPASVTMVHRSGKEDI